MNTQNAHILVVEDAKPYQVLFEDKLQEAGYQTTVAGTKETAKEAITDKPDAVLLDYTLPDGTGQDVLETIRGQDNEWAKSVPVLMFTQHDDPEKIAESVSSGAQAYMVKKDITVAEVIEKVKKQLERTN
jgi:two-component system response regulator HydG